MHVYGSQLAPLLEVLVRPAAWTESIGPGSSTSARCGGEACVAGSPRARRRHTAASRNGDTGAGVRLRACVGGFGTICGIVAQATNLEDCPMTDTETNRETAARSADEDAWEEMLIADLRANGGRPSQGPLQGHPIIVLYSTGAKSGERRRSVLTISTDGEAYVVAGTAGGFPVHAVVGGEPRSAS